MNGIKNDLTTSDLEVVIGELRGLRTSSCCLLRVMVAFVSPIIIQKGNLIDKNRKI